ncbi:respiratory chain complex I subunit 1 family protein [Pseudonocardia endophytica]|uniref:Formate hydrogenlyase subunit 4 n=1 Tax=Pseudonocardia endophytica TaxID=401976 RepID=A0A4R1HZI2_PSEEN|nr:NADH-quinone oxidoreductase subunit H [Pseudonocardia endophytica]TCK27838.1 formate hydrogenlyase subunit 4 [Pseudonocardia endophytica]
MTAQGLLGAGVQLVLVVAGAPLLVGLMRQVRARLEGRAGAGVGQPWRDVRKLFGKDPVTPRGTSEVFRAAPLVTVATTVAVVAVVPFVSTSTVPEPGADLFVVVALLTAGAVATALAGLDTGTAFGGMGASRAITILALVEPTLLVAVLALSVRVGSTDIADIVSATLADPARVTSPAGVLAAAGLALAIVAETGRLPVDNPSTHLELTMVHEAMVLEYAGPDLALVELASAMRLTVFLGLWSTLFLPWGVATGTGVAELALGAVLIVVKIAVLGAALAAAEVFVAKLRLFRVPELLAGSFLLTVLAVVAALVPA